MISLDFAPASTAFILIDLQNGIAGLPLAPHSLSTVLENSNMLAAALRDKGATIVYVRAAIAEFHRLRVDAPFLDSQVPPPPPEASELIDALERKPTDIVIAKRQWGAFYGTELDQLLRRRDIKTIVIGGIATNFGVESTARTAFDRGYEIVFVEDAMSTVSPEAQQFAIQTIFPRMGRVRNTEAVLAALQL